MEDFKKMEELKAQIEAQQKQIEMLTSLIHGGESCECEMCYIKNKVSELYKLPQNRGVVIKKVQQKAHCIWINEELPKRKEKILM